jgi:aminoglycoside/choline kinase family phosphotransferase
MDSLTTSTRTDRRLQQARDWLQDVGVDVQSGFLPVAGDASFRRYYRLQADNESRVLMDAPPPENTLPYIGVTRRLRDAGLHAPRIYADNLEQGFILLEDLGDTLYRDFLAADNVDEHFPVLFKVLERMAQDVDADGLPAYDEELLRFEMDLFPNWYLGHHRSGALREAFDACWDAFCGCVIDAALEQPGCFVHRDFHSCNLLQTGHGSVGVIDFQDAVVGPVSYDFISLIWDRYITWPRQRVEAWMEAYRQLLGLPLKPGEWRRHCDLMGLQRNIKVVGIFARLYYRDGKQGYLEMIPRFYDYALDTLRRYPEFADVLDVMEHAQCAP